MYITSPVSRKENSEFISKINCNAILKEDPRCLEKISFSLLALANRSFFEVQFSHILQL